MSTPATTAGISKRRGLVLALLGACVLAALGTGAYVIWLRDPALDPPDIELAGVADPAVQKAIRDAVEHVRKEPRSPDAWGDLGMILHNHKFADEALTCFQQAERFDPHDVRWPYLQGLIYMSFEPQRAVPKLMQATRLSERATDRPRLRLAELQLQLGNYDDGKKELDSILADNPDHPRANLAMARLHFQRDELKQSRQCLETALAERRTRKSALRLSAEVYQRQGNSQAARRELAEALTLPDDPEWPDPILDQVAMRDVDSVLRERLAGLLVGRGDFPKAAVVLHDVLRDNPESVKAWLLLGQAQMEMGYWPQAEESFAKVLKMQPASTSALFQIGFIKAKQKDWSAAIPWLRKVIEHKPDSLEAHFNLGRCLRETGARKAAIDAFQDALRCQPLSSAAHAQLGELLLQENRVELAMTHLQQAIDLNPKDDASRKLLDEMRKKTTPTKS